MLAFCSDDRSDTHWAASMISRCCSGRAFGSPRAPPHCSWPADLDMASTCRTVALTQATVDALAEYWKRQQRQAYKGDPYDSTVAHSVSRFQIVMVVS